MTLLARMENDHDRLVVIIAGYRADLTNSGHNEGLGRVSPGNIDFPLHAHELVEIAHKMAEQRDSVFGTVRAHDLLFAKLAVDDTGYQRK